MFGLPKTEVVFEEINPIRPIPRFGTTEKNDLAIQLVNLFGCLPTHATYFFAGANSRTPASKKLSSLHWNGTVKMFQRVELTNVSRMCFTIEIGPKHMKNGELREPFKSRIEMRRDYEQQDLSKDSFATFLTNPNLAEVRKKYITSSRERNSVDKLTITVSAYRVEDVLKILIAFLDDSIADANQHYLTLCKQNMSIKELCCVLYPLIS